MRLITARAGEPRELIRTTNTRANLWPGVAPVDVLLVEQEEKATAVQGVGTRSKAPGLEAAWWVLLERTPTTALEAGRDVARRAEIEGVKARHDRPPPPFLLSAAAMEGEGVVRSVY